MRDVDVVGVVVVVVVVAVVVVIVMSLSGSACAKDKPMWNSTGFILVLKYISDVD